VFRAGNHWNGLIFALRPRIQPQTCVIQGDKVVLMDIPSPIHNHRDRVDKERVLTDVEVSLGDNRKQKFEIETIYSHGSPHETHV